MSPAANSGHQSFTKALSLKGPVKSPVPVPPPKLAASQTRTKLVRELRELIAALDRRVPHVERAGEKSIARDAAALRAGAVKRLAELERELPPSASR